MKYISQFLIILGFTLAGEALQRLIPVSIPASVYGITLLFIALCLKIVKLEQVKDVGGFLISILPALFVSPAVGILENWNLIVTADHCQMDATQTINPNVLLANHGFLTLDENGSVTDWRAWCHSTGMSATVHVKDPADEAAVFACLNGQAGIETVFTRAQAAERGYDGEFSFMLEGDGKTKLEDAWLGEYLITHSVKGGHGYLPEKGPWPVFLGAGPSFRPGAVLSMANLVDEAPTLARILGAELPCADGRILNELLI